MIIVMSTTLAYICLLYCIFLFRCGLFLLLVSFHMSPTRHIVSIINSSTHLFLIVILRRWYVDYDYPKQAANVANQREHLILLLSNSQARRFTDSVSRQAVESETKVFFLVN